MRAPSCSATTLIHTPTDSTRPKTAGNGTTAPRTVTPKGTRNALGGGLAEAEHDQRQVRDRESDHRPERERAGQELEVVRDRQAEREHGGDRDRHVRRAALHAQAPDRARDLAVGRERVREPREAEHLAVDRDEQHRRGGRRHEVAARVDEPGGLVGVHDAEDRRLDEAAAERRRAALNRLRHQRGRADTDEQEQGDRRGHDHNPAQAAPPDPHLAGKARGRLDPDQRHAGDAEGEDRVLPVGDLAELDRVHDRAGVEELDEGDDAHRHQHDDRDERHAQHRAEPARVTPRTLIVATSKSARPATSTSKMPSSMPGT